MAKKNIGLLLVLGHEYIRHSDRDFVKETLGACGAYVSKKESLSHEEIVSKLPYAQMNSVFEKMATCYIPLLNMFKSLEADGLDFKISLVITPVLCHLLADEDVKRQFVTWLDERIAVGGKEIERHKKNKPLLNNAKMCLEKAVEAKIDFVDVYGCDLLAAFAEWKKKGVLELLGTTGTNVFLPHFADMAEVVSAQIETGLVCHKAFWGEVPSGFWLPEMGYAEGLEKYIKDYGFEYVVLDGQSVVFADELPESGVFAPLQFDNSLRAVSRLNDFDEQIFGAKGYVANSAYKALERDIGFYLDSEQIFPLVKKGGDRFATGYSYWNKSASGDDFSLIGDASGECLYDADEAICQCQKDAADFVDFAEKKLEAVQKLLPDEVDVCAVCAIDAGRISDSWDEWLWWLENVVRQINETKRLSFVKTEDVANSKMSPQKIRAYPAAWCGNGYGENLLSVKNSWMMRFLRKACERMVDLAEMFPMDTGLRECVLNLGAKELLLALSSGWQRMVDSHVFSEYAKKQFAYFILTFTNVFESLGSNHVSTEWLARMEFEHPIFPLMNYRIFSKKK